MRRRNKKHDNALPEPLDLTSRRDSTDARHLYIHEHEIGLELRHENNCGFAGVGFAGQDKRAARSDDET